MFTGLVEELGTIKQIIRGAKSVRLSVFGGKVLEGVKLGDSIAVNGTCLTVVDFSRNWFTADVMPETVDRTALAGLKPGDTVNLERTLRVGDRLGGHIVSGHIDGVGTIVAKEQYDNAIIVRIGAGPEVMRYIIAKGSIAVDGTSLTVVDFGGDWFTVSLIPHTAAMTTVGLKATGEPVNLEADIIGKYVEKLLGLKQQSPQPVEKITLGFLEQHGFTL
ncbi:riboflavin synthase [Sporomusa acidovorans]|uniref:Riboflavin synthase n=1 Tax=Sporomusa acidovorans (strain ATCC 49682 / DSM 3132 / Mol) TaxID=1123286 RepID=A0ABZ3J2Z4_SPOA4|nr:riboflavin synthase [Sporomusa acidovorans]OZC20211.1 riboflavin synthase [Sporomusa acidovorans DSM 3132]SDD41779.1 riboflavin synthase alpha chain [Sporomusa acidovorans]